MNSMDQSKQKKNLDVNVQNLIVLDYIVAALKHLDIVQNNVNVQIVLIQKKINNKEIMLQKKVNLFKKIVLKIKLNKLMDIMYLYLVVCVRRVVLKNFVLVERIMLNVVLCVNVKNVKMQKLNQIEILYENIIRVEIEEKIN